MCRRDVHVLLCSVKGSAAYTVRVFTIPSSVRCFSRGPYIEHPCRSDISTELTQRPEM